LVSTRISTFCTVRKKTRKLVKVLCFIAGEKGEPGPPGAMGRDGLPGRSGPAGVSGDKVEFRFIMFYKVVGVCYVFECPYTLSSSK